ncbi:LacI family transcriptional regulator [Chitinophaga horti]|uniref:LacI family transcriptional regulator n=1 Tax=Chitinophaga horti TaxID=2920382 RepID=A0ABY6J136_9BACT|nr:LacI family DNA-binding transcriptional regulator [Chitinophaga horti]UYQ93394.1 LacI family transcriptional regulator [Chitinophaga horti]
MKKKISIYDIAREMNVSSATVSYVLNGKAAQKRISASLAQRIITHAREVGYRPNMIAKSLRTGKTRTIGMLVEDIADPFFGTAARIMEGIARQRGYHLFYASTANDAEVAKGLLDVFRSAQADGYIIAPPPGLVAEIQALQEDGLPVVLFDRYCPGLPSANVVADNFGGAYKATRHLLQNGFRRIGLVTSDSSQVQMTDRLRGYAQAIEEADCPPLILQTSAAAKQDIIDFLERHTELDALLFTTGYLTMSGLEALAHLQLRAPEDIAVVSFDDHPHFSLFSPAVTAVAQPVQTIAETVIGRLIDSLESNTPLALQTDILPISLIIRDSSARVAVQHR